MASEITYRLASDADISLINDLYNTVYKKSRTTEQFVWEYNSAPAGRAIYVIAVCDGKVVGTQCAIPMWVITRDNREILTAKLEDVLVSPDHRGKNIFGNMYKFSIEECRRQNMGFIWGFAYIIKEYRKIGFEIPFKNTMGMLVTRPTEAANYFYSITAKKNTLAYFKILSMSYLSYARSLKLKLQSKAGFNLQEGPMELNNEKFNYLKSDGLFGLKLDHGYLDYRIYRNPYSKNYKTVSWQEGGVLKASLTYNITKQNVGFIIHVYFDKHLSQKECSQFMQKVIFETGLKNCSVTRFWGFTNNGQSKQDVDMLRRSGFMFLDRGISLVWLKLDQALDIDPEDFVLSRMASQGTD